MSIRATELFKGPAMKATYNEACRCAAKVNKKFRYHYT